MLTRDEILALDDLGTAIVDVPAWGGAVRVRGMTLGEQDRFELAMREDKALVRARVLTWCIIDEHGKPIFREEDAPILARHSAAIFLKLWEAIARLSGLVDEASLGKGSHQPGASHSISPSVSGVPSES